MKQNIIILVILSLVSGKPDLFVGTGGFGFGCGSNSPAVQMPYSYVRLGPDTTPIEKVLYEEFQHYGGYSSADHAVRAFSHMHLVGAGVGDLGVLGILPVKPNSPEKQPQIPNDPLIQFFKQQEHAEPGYYSSLLNNKIKVQLTTTQRCAAHRYSRTDASSKPIDLNIMTWYLLEKSAKRTTKTERCGDRCLQGQVWVGSGFGGRFGGYFVYFYLLWEGSEADELFLYEGEIMVNDSASGNKTGAIIRTHSQNIDLFVGLSYVSLSNAKENLNKQIPTLNFTTVRHQALQRWHEQLSRFELIGITQAHQTKLDTAVYRSLLTPTLFNDHNGEYASFANNGKVAVVPEWMNGVYTDMSLWDVHRTNMPWLLLHDPMRYQDVVGSLMLFNRDGGYMPKWPFANGWTGCMIGAHANTVMADWVVKESGEQHRQYVKEILKYMVRNADEQTPHDSRPNPSKYIQQGYIDCESSSRSGCSQTLQFSYNDFGIGQVARILNESSIAEDFSNRSLFYKNVWNVKTKFFQPRHENGTFKVLKKGEHENIFSNNYVEGDAWHYRFYAPHDASGLIGLFGGEKEFVKQLEVFFKRSLYWPTLWLPNPYYWAGNQHNLFSVWLFTLANHPDLTAKYSRAIIDKFYGLEGNGLPGNDDYGTMSAWLIFASLGFYPLPSTQDYILGSPTVHYASITRVYGVDDTRILKIRVHNNSINNFKISSWQINGEKQEKTIKHSKIKNQTYMEITMKK